MVLRNVSISMNQKIIPDLLVMKNERNNDDEDNINKHIVNNVCKYNVHLDILKSEPSNVTYNIDTTNIYDDTNAIEYIIVYVPYMVITIYSSVSSLDCT